ncbi:Uncharacterized protein C11orf57 [Chlamydotis macqueenii]|uniref:uncharacterized protein C11orf57 homolog n=1 Tax=Chlamydotis macqueenii TaxID=187382 RepID=UPI0005297CD6|nr:PREDICTED: uncharacterized protein C11orf57 homolog [Chlamydotis macqueenii]KFP36222.1 Uncharacterized protein C11orf57 [Chlamydotis macqueenii]
MSRVPVGKVLLRNVIRHTGAHNKIQEETEMWKIREWEKQAEETYWKRQSRMLSDTSSRMRSDGFDEEGYRADWKTRNSQFLDPFEDDLLRARSWNKKLYECEASMPDRWGHSGYKELYPEEFDTDSDQQEGDEQNAINGKKKSHLSKQTARESHKRKKTKKSHKKKQKKRSHKKRKKKKKEQGRTSSDSSRESECSGETSGTRKGKHKRKKKTRKVPAKEPTSSGQESDFSHARSSTTSSSEDSESEDKKEKRPPKKRKKRHNSVSERHNEVPEKRSKRKNWKVAADEKSEDSSDED